MAISPARLTANSQNAQLSTGPRSADGKARSSQNARKHGLTSRDLVVAPDETAEFEEFLVDFQAEIAPRGPSQQTLFNELVAAAWNLRRVHRMETGLSNGSPAEIQNQLERLARHSTRLERTFHRCLKELKALQTNMAIHATLVRPLRETLPALASANEIAKRTQYLEKADPLLLRGLATRLAPPSPEHSHASAHALP